MKIPNRILFKIKKPKYNPTLAQLVERLTVDVITYEKK